MSKDFKRKDLHKKKRLSDKWRKPKGITNKMRLSRKGHAKKVKPGFGTKKSEKGKHRSGLEIIMISKIEQLKNINPKTQGIIIAKTGMKKKLEIIREAEKLKITILNLRVEKYKEHSESLLAKKKEQAKEREKKETAKKEAEKKAEKKKEETKPEPEVSEEEKKKQEKQEMEKIITKSK